MYLKWLGLRTNLGNTKLEVKLCLKLICEMYDSMKKNHLNKYILKRIDYPSVNIYHIYHVLQYLSQRLGFRNWKVVITTLLEGETGYFLQFGLFVSLLDCSNFMGNLLLELDQIWWKLQ